ncbi:DinB family protein [Lederbergia citri]|uniref:DinB family protein n=1 Tax=Lederbergia citri TaxID=2833580 RepID=UPI001F17CF31|nr:DinB family protein [Lederbergia citri]
MSTTTKLSSQDTDLINQYNEAPKKLADALSGLSDNELDKKRAEGKWSIREIAHHIIECDLNYFQINRYALADTGAKFIFNEFDPNTWNQNMEHSKRSIQLELQLFTIMREYIAYLCSSLPNGFDRVLIHQDGKATVRDALQHDIQHANHHIEQILETKKIHNL